MLSLALLLRFGTGRFMFCFVMHFIQKLGNFWKFFYFFSVKGAKSFDLCFGRCVTVLSGLCFLFFLWLPLCHLLLSFVKFFVK
jgi:hypothetical protein